MHIPDGYISPQTSLVLGVAMLPIWWHASHKVTEVIKGRDTPLLALGAAFTFVVMMFNIPVPGGTSAHAVGAGLVAVLLGPWAACIAVTIAVLIQALLFGDGGVLAFPANALNMAVIMPFVAYGAYRVVAAGSAVTSWRRVAGAALGGYLGINAAALATAVELGLQPLLFHKADGTPLYAPFDLPEVTLAMTIPHLLIAGLVEAAVTAGVISYLRRAHPALLRINNWDEPAPRRSSRSITPVRAGLTALGIMALISPLGLLAEGTAVGEEAPEDLDLAQYHLSAIPEGLRSYSDFWGATLLPDYGDGSGWQYIVSAIIGMTVAAALVAGVTWSVRKLATRGTPVSGEA